MKLGSKKIRKSHKLRHQVSVEQNQKVNTCILSPKRKSSSKMMVNKLKKGLSGSKMGKSKRLKKAFKHSDQRDSVLDEEAINQQSFRMMPFPAGSEQARYPY